LWPHVRFEHKLVRASWSSARTQWTLDVQLADGSRRRLHCGFLFSCAGYYRHDHGHLPNWPGYADYQGSLVHPQFWPDDLDWAGKRVVIIGSGATAVTLSPVLAESAAHVWQLQRSPTYMVTRPAVDDLAETLKRWLPDMLAYQLVRWRNILRN